MREFVGDEIYHDCGGRCSISYSVKFKDLDITDCKLKQDMGEIKSGTHTTTHEPDYVTDGWSKHTKGNGKEKSEPKLLCKILTILLDDVKIKTKRTVPECYTPGSKIVSCGAVGSPF